MDSKYLPTLILTAGEPAGIGPDLAVMISHQQLQCRLAVCADAELLAKRADMLGVELVLDDWQGQVHKKGHLAILPHALNAEAVPGELHTDNAQYVLDTIRLATERCLSGEFDALVTGPIQKSIINDAGIAFTGHTEFLAELSDTPRVVMMLTADTLRVALATTHLPLRDVSDHITRELLVEVIQILDRELQNRFGLDDPRIIVCGLNPHAGEGGHLGSEEAEIIEPVLASLRSSGIKLIGPLPADTAFVPEQLKQADAVLAMYHDQGLPVLKHAGFGQAVNITLGLPFIRTSVDHGTALSRAGTGNIDEGSLLNAMQMAIEMSRNDKHKLQP